MKAKINLKNIGNGKQPSIQKHTHVAIYYCVIIAIITFIAFMPALNNGFTNFDDDDYVVNNPDIRGFSVHNLAMIFSSNYVGNYQPVTMLTYLVEYQFCGINSTIYHATNLLLHIVNCLLVFALIFALSRQYLLSLLVALLFAIHPMRVESVAWIAERKDLLSSFFYFLSLLSYLRYVKKGNRKYYYLCALSLLFSLLSKPMAVSQPFVLLLIDYLRLHKIDKKAILDKIPFLIISAVFVVLTLLTQKSSDIISEYSYIFSSIPILQRICVPFYGILFYILKSVFPFKLCAYYPISHVLDKTMDFIMFASPFLVLGIAGAIYYFRRRSYTLVFGSLYFLITSLPVLQIVPVGSALVAERYTYIPMLGMYFIFAVLCSFLLKEIIHNSILLRILFFSTIVILIVSFTYLTHERCGVWKDSISLWNDVIDKFPVAIAFNSRGVAYGKQGNYIRAIEDFNQAIQIDPMSALAHNNRGLAYNALGDHNSAIEDFTQSVKLNPIGPMAYNNRGLVYKALGEYNRALDDFSQAANLNPRNFETYYNRGLTYNAIGDIDHAIGDYSQAIKINPTAAHIFNNRGLAYKAKGDENHAIEDYTQAINVNPRYAVAYINRGVSYCVKSEFGSAIEDYTRAINLNPNSVQGYYNRGLAYKAMGDYNRAEYDIKIACGFGLDAACKMLSGN